MYIKEEYDYLFYRMKKLIPNNKILFYFVTIMKLYPLFILVHSGGYLSAPENLYTVHTYFSYFSLSYYLQNSFTAGSLQILNLIITIINSLLIGLIVYYMIRSKNIKKLDENYDNSNTLGYVFYIFSNISFFKYIIMFQFFLEINALPLICIPNALDTSKIRKNEIFSNVGFFLENKDMLCGGGTFIIQLVLSFFNIIVDVVFHYILTSRFFDFNILSNYFWNFYPSIFVSFEFMESCAQVFFILFLDYNTYIYKIALNTYICLLFIIKLFQYLKTSTFCTAETYNYVFIAQYIRIMCYTSTVFIAIFQFGLNTVPNDINIVGLLIFEVIFVYLFMKILHVNDKSLIHNILVSSSNELNEKNIYSTLIFLIKEFKVFSDVGKKFSDSNLDLFLENYVNHLKKCDDIYCPCKNYVKKITGASNTIKSGYTTVINFTHMKKEKNEEYILNKFFNVLAANINVTLKYTNNVNINNMKDSQRQKLIYQLRTKLIIAVRKLLSYRLEKLSKEIDGVLTNQFKKETKDFIRINFYSVNILLNKSYYKTQFLYYEFFTNYLKRQGNSYHLNMIYYLYLKLFSVKEYNDHQAILKQGRRDNSNYHYMDFRFVLSQCIKFYEIEERLIKTSFSYESFIHYFINDKIIFDNLLELIKHFKTQYKSVTQYIAHYFKNEKINNLFVCTKIILFFKILHFDIPEVLHNKLIIQMHDNDDLKKYNSNNDSCYYMIINYTEGEFKIKFISHELLIVLEYNEDEIRDHDFNCLLPEKLRKLHKNVIINEIKSHATNSNGKEIFFVTKSNSCVLFDIQYKFLLNLKGEITLLTVVNLKKPSKDFRVCFACIDYHGEILALNKEFEEYLILSMRLLNHVKVDTESLIFQNNSQRMRNFFKDEENTEYQENFDYDQFLSSLFEEEFDILKEKDEVEYRKKYARWEVLKEMNRKGNYYTRFIDLNIKQRVLGKEIIYFAKYSVKITLSLKSIEPHSTTLSFIHAVKISKREMAKLSFYRGDEIYESKNDKSVNEEKIESHDDLFESQSQISSAMSQLKERNMVRLFKQKRKTFKIIPRGRNIFLLMVSIGLIGFISIVYNITILYVKIGMYHSIHNDFNLGYNSLVLKNSIYTLTSAIIMMSLDEENIIKDNIINHDEFMSNLYDLFSSETELMNNAIYNISYLSSQLYSEMVDKELSLTGKLSYIFSNGLIYSKTDVALFQELNSINKLSKDFLYYYDNNLNDSKDNVFLEYYFLNKIFKIQENIVSEGLYFNEKATTLFFLMNNVFESIDDYLNTIFTIYQGELNYKSFHALYSILIIKIVEYILICIIISIEWLFIFFGYAKAKKKMVSLRQIVERNNIDLTLKKVNEFIHFSNNFNINSLYYIADLDIKRIEDSSKTSEFAQSSSNKNQSALMLNTNSNSNITAMGPKKKNLTSQMLNGNLRDKDSHEIYGMHSNDNTNDEKDIGIRLLHNNSNSNLNDFNNHNNEKMPLNDSKEGKNNLLKVIHKLDQIKGIKKNKALEKKESETSNKSKNSKCSSNESEMNNIANNDNKLDNNDIEQEENNSNLNDQNGSADENENENENHDEFFPIGKDELSSNNKEEKYTNCVTINGVIEPVKSALKNDKSHNYSNKNVNNRISSKAIIRFNDNNIGQEDDSKLPIVKPNEEGLNLTKKKNRNPKVHFKEHNSHLYKYYNPGQNVNDVVDLTQCNIKQAKPDKEQKDSLVDKPTPNQGNINIKSEPNIKQPSLLSAIQVNSKSSFTQLNQLNQKENKVKFDLNLKDNTQVQMNKDIKGDSNFDLKDSSGFSKFHLIDQGKAVTVKKKMNSSDNIVNNKDVIEDKIDSVVHRNSLAKHILNVNLFFFTVIYITSMVFNVIYRDNINTSLDYTSLLVNKNSLYQMIALLYQILVIKGEHDNSLVDYVYQAELNKKKLIDFYSGKYSNIFPSVYLMESIYNSNDSCSSFSEYYSQEFKTDSKQEYNQCTTVANQLNINGFTNAEIYVLSTLTIHIDDWQNILKNSIIIDEELILAKLKDISHLNVVIGIETTFRKYYTLILRYILKDVNLIFQTIVRNEEIFGYLSVCLNIVFLFLSLVFIIYPIKFVEMIISWFIHKIMKN